MSPLPFGGPEVSPFYVSDMSTVVNTLKAFQAPWMSSVFLVSSAPHNATVFLLHHLL